MQICGHICVGNDNGALQGFLKQLSKGKYGGSGLATIFEGWFDDKLPKYDIDPDIYDHSNIDNRSTILLQC